jgi:hypothetical protein
MKNKVIVPQLPDSLLHQDDLPDERPTITQHEIVALANAYHIFKIARADYEMKRASVALKLYLLCKCEGEDSGYDVELNQNGGLILTDRTGIPFELLVMGEGDATPAEYH